MGLFNSLRKKKEAISSEIDEIRPEYKSIQDVNESIDFDSLVENAKTSNNKEDLDILYSSFFGLSHWFFVTTVKDDIAHAKPFIGLTDDQPWLYAFTDGNHAQTFAKLNPDTMLLENGASHIIKMTAKGSFEMAMELSNRGVFGIRVNEGEHGWFFPIQNMPNILNYLNIELL
jgi:hypothetical protein